MSGGIDALEAIGRKTMDVISEGDPGMILLLLIQRNVVETIHNTQGFVFRFETKKSSNKGADFRPSSCAVKGELLGQLVDQYCW